MTKWLKKIFEEVDFSIEEALEIILKDIFVCLFSIHNITSLSCHEQVCLSGLHFERYFSHHRAYNIRNHFNQDTQSRTPH